ncbi:methyltransferase domain-containing protein [Rhodopirellula sallentina]|uniref:Ribosomal RNA large subunit methyltransferase A n=1 Tax=Rhodopirellula sallentina SM41 TaxID=1263870 RepID=M5U923_9BACT|nr:methyltransferase domain-containing protein [Rhodopirellula sallentina]EMI57967.1 ribosomal RNA large subunit methyltransferase A [Rhodopirellula sallentina SM41]
MFELRCTVRNCQNTLVPSDAGLTCDARHHFDRAKQGHWNLTQPQDRKSKTPGDCDDAVMARHRWLARGHAEGLVAELSPWIEKKGADKTFRTLDLGCGEGYFGPALFSDEPDGYCGIDLSKTAIKLAARRWPAATWVLANADRELPVADASVDRIVSLFGRRPITEIQRCLSPEGICVIAVPGEEDLIELREHVQQAGHRRRRGDMIIEEMEGTGLRCVEQRTWKHQVTLDSDAIHDALAMTYRAVRHSQQARLSSIDTMDVTLAADLLLFRHG